MSLPPALAGERLAFDGLNCYVAGSGPPLLLVHSVNAAASAAEVRPLFDHYRATRTVFALDLPGYGFSDRSDRAYTPRLMTDALHAVAAQIRDRCGEQDGNQGADASGKKGADNSRHAPIDALAVSLACEFLARAAVERPAHWGRLALISPTGFNGGKARRGPPGSTYAVPALHSILSRPLWAEALFRGLTLPSVIRYFLERTWGGKAIDETLWAYCVQTTREAGARHAPLHFLSGGLFSADIHRVYESLTQPVWVGHGDRGDFTDYRGLTLVQSRPNWRCSVFAAGALPYFELPDVFDAAFDAFLSDAASPAP